MASILNNFFSNDLAIDLGTANTLVYVKNRGVVLNEPSVVAINHEKSGIERVIAVGHQAKQMLGRTPQNITAIRPMMNGVIADFEVTQIMLHHFIKKASPISKLFKPQIIICVPCGTTPVEKRAVRESVEQLGARKTFLIEEPMAAAIGANLPVTEATGNMIVDIGGGTTEVGIISLGGVVFSHSIRVAGDRFDEAVAMYLKKKYSLLIGEHTAEQVKIILGNASNVSNEVTSMEVKGRDLIVGSPKIIEVTSEEIRDALTDPINEIIEVIRTSLERIPPELAADIVDNGIILAGGGAMLHDLDTLIQEKTGLPVFLADDPITCVVRGCGKVLESPALLEQVITFG